MLKQTVQLFTVTSSLAAVMFAQNPRQATMVGGGNSDRGRCAVEVIVDGAAQVEIRGATATLRTTSGQPAQWRRFECTGAMPGNMTNFRFSGVDGRTERIRYRTDEEYRPNYRDSDYYRRYGHPFAVDEAVRVCQQAVQSQAARRFRTNDIHFHRTSIDNNPGREDWVTGTVDVHR